MENNRTKQISNEKAEAAIIEYKAERTKENFSKVLNLLRPSQLFVPALINEDKKPLPLFLKNNEEEQFLAVFTSQKHASEELKRQAVMVMPFPVCNSLVANDKFNLKGMVINPYTDNLILKTELVKRLYEADITLAKQVNEKRAELTPAQYRQRIRSQVEYGILPGKLYTEGEAFVNRLCDEKEALIYQIFSDACIGGKGNPFSKSDFAVMAMTISSNLLLIRVDMPAKADGEPFCYRVYVTFHPETKESDYYVIEKNPKEEGRRLGRVGSDGKHEDIGEAPVEGVELQEIIDRSSIN